MIAIWWLGSSIGPKPHVSLCEGPRYTHGKVVFHSSFKGKKKFDISKQWFTVEHPNTAESGI